MLTLLNYLQSTARRHPYLGILAAFSILILYKRLTANPNASRHRRALHNKGISELLFNNGYKVSKEGVCNGIRRVALFAYLSGQQDLFMKALWALNYFDAKDNESLAHVGKTHTPDMWNILAVSDHIALNAEPNNYRPIFNDSNRGFGQMDVIQESAKLFELDDTREERKGVVRLHLNNRVYSYAQWVAMFQELDAACQQLDSSDAPVSVSVFASNHTHSFFYNVNKKAWHMLESNEIKSSAFTDTKSAKNIMRLSWYLMGVMEILQKSFLEAQTYLDIVSFLMSTNRLTISTEIHTTTHGANLIAPLLKDWCDRQAILASDLNSLTDKQHLELLEHAVHTRNNATMELCEQQPRFNRQEALLRAVNHYDSKAVSRWLSDFNVDPNYKNGCYLYNAIDDGQVDIVALLLQRGDIDPNYADPKWTGWYLNMAIKNDQKAIIDLLLQHRNIDPNGLVDGKPLIEVLGSDHPMIPVLRAHPNFKETVDPVRKLNYRMN